MLLYSKTTGLAYPDGYGYKEIPTDAIEISQEILDVVINNPEPGKTRMHTDKGVPFLIDSPPPGDNEKQAQTNAEAREYLASTDWYVIRSLELGRDIPEQILKNRAEARSAVTE